MIKRKQKGFTLLEFVIAFSVVTVVLSGVWLSADIVFTNSQQQKAREQVLTIVQDIKDYYLTRGIKLPGSAGDDISAQLDDLGLIPVGMRSDPTVSGGNLFHALGDRGASATFVVQKVGASGTVLRIQVLDLTSVQCSKFLIGLPLLSPEFGIVRIATGTANKTVDARDVRSDASVLPSSVSVANSWCAVAGNNNDISIDFNLRY